MTYGQIKLRLTQAFPGVSLDLIEGWVNDRYQEILGELPWSRLTVQATLTTVAGKSVYALPANCGILRDDALANSDGTMTRFAHGQLNDGDPTRSQTGEPFGWASAMDDNSTPPNMQVELYPTPDAIYSLPLEYTAEVPPMGATSTLLQVWIQPAALMEGATAKIKAHLKDYIGAQFHTATAERALKNMRGSNAQALGPSQMTLDPYYTRHRRNRWGGGYSNDSTNDSTNLQQQNMQTIQLPTFVDNEIPAGVIDGANQLFTLANAPNPATSLHLTLNGLELRAGDDYALNGRAVTFVAAQTPEVNDSITASYRF